MHLITFARRSFFSPRARAPAALCNENDRADGAQTAHCMGNACSRRHETQEAPRLSPIYSPPGLDVCREVTIGRKKTNKFRLASEIDVHGGHVSMGASSVLDGCPVQEDSGGACLLIIDPQADFHEGGSLAVAGATGDSERIAALLLRHAEQIDRVVVTLDTHHTMHIAHAAFWKDAAGASPAPHTAITHAEVKAGKCVPRQQELANPHPHPHAHAHPHPHAHPHADPNPSPNPKA